MAILTFRQIIIDLVDEPYGCDLSFRRHSELPAEWHSLGELVAFVTSFQQA